MSGLGSRNGLGTWTGVTYDAVQAAIEHADGPIRVKDIGRIIGVDMTVEKNLKAVSNACGYLLRHNQAHRVELGVYQAGPGPQEGKAMTMTMSEQDSTMLEAARASLDASRAAAPAAAPIICDLCGKECASEMGLKAHLTRSHPRGLTPDEAFERTGQALDVLFPNGIPTSRLIELADLQKQMLRAIK